MDIINLNYNGHHVPVNIDKDTGIKWFSLTEMAKRFDADTSEWLSNAGTKEYLSAVFSLYASKNQTGNSQFENFQVVKALRGGRHPGTWGTQEVAMEFARWLNPAFGVWCNQQIMELVAKGSVQLTVDSILDLKIWTIIGMADKKEKFGYQLQMMLKYLKGDKVKCKEALGRVFSGMRGDFDKKDRLFKLTYDNLMDYHGANGKSMGAEVSSEFCWVVEYALREWKNYRGRSIGQTGTKRDREPSPLPKSLIENVVLD